MYSEYVDTKSFSKKKNKIKYLYLKKNKVKYWKWNKKKNQNLKLNAWLTIYTYWAELLLTQDIFVHYFI